MGKLVRLELYNFKSYKGHHVLLFGDAHFTSIIGPNGSGKSNSMDAISFVLGIKSSHLRSTHLRDLIYRGRILKTSKIQADGTAAEEHGHEDRVNGVDGEGEEVDMSSQRNDATTAWVMAVYEDDMGEEQHWKRTVTSSGHSEYQVNNRRVSANEYNEILEAENILVKARNFLVFQGDVENVASQSPKDLTRLVEQISGSLEYKSDYDRLQIESEKAAEDQQFKLNQRRGINAEIKQYQEQKKEAENFNRKAEDRDNAVVTHVLWKLYQFQRVIEESGAEIQRHQDELKEHKRNVETYEKRLEESKKDQFKAGKEVAKSERTIKSTEKDIDEKMHDLVPIDEKIDLSSKNLERYRKRIDEITKEKKSQSKSVDDIKQNLGKVTKAQSKWEADSKKAAESEGRQLSDKDLQEYNKIRAEVNKKAATSQIKVDNLVRQRKTDEETVNNLRSSVEESERMIQKLQSENVEIQERHENHSSQAKQYSSDIDKKKREFNQMTSKRLQAAQRRTELDERLQQVLQKLIEADDGRRQSEKEIRARETVASMKRIFPGVKGRLHELCKPKQKKFETAVSTVLGRNFDSIIVDTEKTAKDCITWLRDQQAGQATFIPLETIQVKAVSSNLKGMHKKMTLAIDTINYDHALEPAMSYACGNAMVCDDLETAKFLCYQKNIEARAVTLEGTVIHKGGLMTGGRGPNDNSNRKWADSEVENLRKQKDKLMADLASLPQGHKAITDEESLQAELSGLEQRLAYAQQEMKALEKNQQSKKKELAFVQKQLKESKPKYEESSRNLSTLEQRIKEFQQEVSTVEDGLFGAFCKRLGYDNIRAYEAQQGALQQEAAQKKLEFSTQRSKLENQLTFESGRLQSTKDRIKSLEEQSKRDEDLISSLQEEKQAMEEELVEIRNALEETKAQLQQQKEVHDEKSEKVSDARKQVQKRNKDAQFLHDSLTKLESDINRTASQRYALLRKCKMEQVKLPLTDSSTALDSLPIDDAAGAQRDPEAMDVDDEEENLNAAEVIKDYGIEVSFEVLDDDLKDDPSDDLEKTLKTQVETLAAELTTLNPSTRAIERLNVAENRLKTTDKDYDSARKLARQTKEAFEDVRNQRTDLFNRAFEHISSQIDPVYKALTRSQNSPMGGKAYLDAMGADDEAPFLGGLKYHAMPPLKRFRDMDALSGGEKTIAALALLFALHSYAPSPFFVLDEVDAALDNANVSKVARYIREHARPGMQFIVISLKTGLFQESETLVGVLRDQGANSSRAVTLDLREYQPT